MATVSHLNIKEVPEIIDLAVQHRAGIFCFARYVPTGPDKTNEIKPLEYREFLDKCYKKYEKYRNEGCHIGLSGCILPDGTLLACRRTAESEIGNIFDDDFLAEENMYEKKRLAYRELSKYEDCSRCKLAQWCRGCHAVSRGQFGDFFARDPQCWHVVE